MNNTSRTRRWAGLLLIACSLSSCYSVRIMSKDGVPEPDPQNRSEDFYRGKKVYHLDTTIGLKLQDGDVHLVRKCGDCGFYSLEYRVTFGGALLSAVTFGKRRRVHIKYVCIKQSN